MNSFMSTAYFDGDLLLLEATTESNTATLPPAAPSVTEAIDEVQELTSVHQAALAALDALPSMRDDFPSPTELRGRKNAMKVPGLYLITGFDLMSMPTWFERAFPSATPVTDRYGRSTKGGRLRIQQGHEYHTNGRMTDATPFDPEVFEFAQYVHWITSSVAPDLFSDKGEELSTGRIVPDQFLMNHYRSGQVIAPHIDNIHHFGEVVVCVTFGGPRVMRFSVKGQGPNNVYDVELSHGSMYVMSDRARYDYHHEMLKSTEECWSATFRYTTKE